MRSTLQQERHTSLYGLQFARPRPRIRATVDSPPASLRSIFDSLFAWCQKTGRPFGGPRVDPSGGSADIIRAVMIQISKCETRPDILAGRMAFGFRMGNSSFGKRGVTVTMRRNTTGVSILMLLCSCAMGLVLARGSIHSRKQITSQWPSLGTTIRVTASARRDVQRSHNVPL